MNKHQNEVFVTEYNSGWPKYFLQLKDFIWPLVKEHAIAFEHVGSTSVEGLAAKPVIDIDIIVQNENQSKKVTEQLIKLGFEHRGDLGIQGREAFTQLPQFYKQNLYVCLENSLALANHLNFRDYLRNNPNAVTEYDKIKFDLASKTSDMSTYIESKTSFITKALAHTGISKEALFEIEEINKK